MPRILADRHGLYVKAGGFCYRPKHSVPSKVHSPNIRDGSDLYQNDNVTVRPEPGSPLCRVTDHKRYETWFSHGPLTDGECWNPWDAPPIPIHSPAAKKRMTVTIAKSMDVYVGGTRLGRVTSITPTATQEAVDVLVRKMVPVHAPPRKRTRIKP